VRIRAKGEGDVDEIYVNLTPMIDCLLNILFFYMLTTTFLTLEKDMDVALPDAKSGRPEHQDVKEIVINVLADGRMKVGDQCFEQDALIEHLKQLASGEKDVPVTIRGDKQTVFQNAVHALDACGRANLHRIAFGVAEAAK
jgi:biopolymer transport protein ExbD